jgi:hypothetical protein
MTDLRVLSDRPTTDDLLGFNRYVEPLVNILSNPNTETPFTVGIYGTWGSGKSSLLDLIERALDSDAFVCVRFNPWVYRGEPNMLIPLLHTLRDTLGADKKGRFLESAKKIGSVLVSLGANLFLKNVTAGAIDIEGLEKIQEKFVTTHESTQSEMRNLRNTLQDEVSEIAAKGAKLVFFIDDLDRCEPDEIIGLLESIKLFLDFENVFILLAVDKEIVDRGIQIKYRKLELDQRAARIGAEYLEKMVQLPLHLFPLGTCDVKQFMRDSEPPAAVVEQIPLLSQLVVANPRKIKRVLNLLAVRLSIAEKGFKEPAKRPAADLLARMVVLQVQCGELYDEIVEAPDALVALEQVYNGDKEIDAAASFSEFKERAGVVEALCRTYYIPESFLAPLLAGSPFKSPEVVRACLMTLGVMQNGH